MTGKITTKEFYEAKAKAEGYDDFLHWIDCFDYEEQPEKIIQWTDEWVAIKLKDYECSQNNTKT